MYYMYITNLPFFQTSVPKVDTKFDKLKDTVPRNKDCISAYAKAKDAGEDCAEPPFLHRFWNHEAQEMAGIFCDTPRNATYNLDFSALSQSYGRCSLPGATPDRGKIRAKLCNKLVWDLGLEELQVLLVETTLFSNKFQYSTLWISLSCFSKLEGFGKWTLDRWEKQANPTAGFRVLLR